MSTAQQKQPGERWPPSEFAVPEFVKAESDERVLGRYAACARLLTSPVFNKIAREVIREDAERWRAALEERGFHSTEPER